ncbi:Glucosamine/galactosamine-6-phosphate isomerase [Dillenia turbinata]|uniref:Glucosamine/galactosamine-6-phosphate isomerase n=1 Tax=Dillenia turbinata TaxID=194707 RepID=A0AAN8VGP6_9MAGN
MDRLRHFAKSMAHSEFHNDRGELRIYESVDELGTDLADYVAELSELSVKERGVFAVALSGGSLIDLLGKLCKAPYNRTIDWAKWYIFWADERVVAKNHADSNYKLAKDGVLSKVFILIPLFFFVYHYLLSRKGEAVVLIFFTDTRCRHKHARGTLLVFRQRMDLRKNVMTEHRYFVALLSFKTENAVMKREYLPSQKDEKERYHLAFSVYGYGEALSGQVRVFTEWLLNTRRAYTISFKLSQAPRTPNVPIVPSHVHSINDSVSAEEAADDYEFAIRQMVRTRLISVSDISDCPKFDLILLGMGSDGHIASLFPNHLVLDEKDQWVTYITDSPKPPPERITFTLPVINSASNVALVVTGENKAQAVHLAVDAVEPDCQSIPARMVQPTKGKLVWFLDRPAASKLNNSQLRN